MATWQVCSLPWCRQSGAHLTFHKFPSEQIRQMQWLTLLDVNEAWKNVSHEKISTYSICSRHIGIGGTVRRYPAPVQLNSTCPNSRPSQISSVPATSSSPESQITLNNKKCLPQSHTAQHITNKMRQQVDTHSSNLNSTQSGATKRSSSTEITETYNNKIAKLPTLEVSNSSSGPTTRESFSLAKKVEVIRALQSGMRQAEVFRTMKLHRSTVNHFWRNRDKILKAFHSTVPSRKRLRKARYEEVDVILYEWYNKNIASQNEAITGRHLQTMAESIAEQDLGLTDFVCNPAWIDRFKQRYGIKLNPSKTNKDYHDQDIEQELSNDQKIVNDKEQPTENYDSDVDLDIKSEKEFEISNDASDLHQVDSVKVEICDDQIMNDDDLHSTEEENDDDDTEFLLEAMEDCNSEDFIRSPSPMMSDPLEFTTDHHHHQPSTTALDTAIHIDQTYIIKEEMDQKLHPMSLLSPSEIQVHLDGLRVWMTTRSSECPRVVLDALGTLESFTHGHLS